MCHDALHKLTDKIAKARMGDLAKLLEDKADFLASNIASGNNHNAFVGIK